MAETTVRAKTFDERRKAWGEGLKKIGCSIEDKGRYLIEKSIYYNNILDEYIEADEKQGRKEECEYVRKIIKRNS